MEQPTLSASPAERNALNSPIRSDIDPVKSTDNPSLIVTQMLAGRTRLPRLSDGVLLYLGNPGGVIFLFPVSLLLDASFFAFIVAT